MEKKDKNSARKIGKKANFYLPVINFHRKQAKNGKKTPCAYKNTPKNTLENVSYETLPGITMFHVKL